jgi:hypothetical protein
MNFIVEVTKLNINNYLDKYTIIACKIRNSRLKAKQLAILEMVFAQYDNEIMAIKNGPLGDIKGLISFFCPKKNLALFKDRLFGIGYCFQFYELDFENGSCENATDLNSINPLVWKGRKFSINNFFTQDNAIYEEQSPHRRAFKILSNDGEVKTIFGYRGDGREFGRRSLPVEDSRCMVNISLPHKNKKMLDPFAGAGGIIYSFRFLVPDGTMTSIDIDPVLKPGLEFFGSTHHVMNAVNVSFAEGSFDSVITEVPFSQNAIDFIIQTLTKLNTCLSNSGVLVIMCGKDQVKKIYNALDGLGNSLLFNYAVNRKGIDVEISIWWKDKNLPDGMEDSLSVLKTMY